jgi:N-dimethylarginine dimethylaminohydrolase
MGPAEVLHLKSLVSLLDERLAVANRPLLPVPFVELLAERGIELIASPEDELPTQDCNVLALAPLTSGLGSDLVSGQERNDAVLS